MKNIWVRSSLLAAFLPAFAYSARAQTSPQKAATNLGGTSCQLVKFESGDGKTLTPEDRSKYTVTFEAEGRVSARVGLQPWDRCSPAPLTCARTPSKMVISFFRLMADGGIYEFEPVSIKAILALDAYAVLAGKTGHPADAIKYHSLAGQMAKHWTDSLGTEIILASPLTSRGPGVRITIWFGTGFSISIFVRRSLPERKYVFTRPT